MSPEPEREYASREDVEALSVTVTNLVHRNDDWHREQARNSRRFGPSELLAGVAILGLIGTAGAHLISGTRTYAAMEIQITNATKVAEEARVKANQVDKLGWDYTRLSEQLNRVDAKMGAIETKVGQIHESLIKMGMQDLKR